MKALRVWITPLAALIIAFGIGAILISMVGNSPWLAYKSLFTHAFGSAAGIEKTFGKATPLIFSGLAVTICLRAGLFNIGVQGQLIAGSIAAAWAGYAITSVPIYIHLPLSLFFGIFFGALVGWLSGALKAYRGVHEVISTIMLNSIILALVDYLAGHTFKEPGQILARTPAIKTTATIPTIFNLPVGFFIAIILAVLFWWIFKRTTTGFRLETLGRNKHAAWYAGISVKKTTLLAMTLGGAIAGLGGAVETLGITGRFEPAFNTGLGFDGITIALLGRSNPLGIIPGAILIGGMRSAASNMQFDAGVAPEIVDLILAMILFLVTAPILAKWIKGSATDAKIISGWGN